jgi:Rrf2 family protein
MLALTHTTGYAILAMSCLEQPDGSWVLSREIAESAGIPRPYLAKILNALSRSGLIKTKRGYRGGVALARPAERISLMDVVEAVEGRAWMPRCLLGLRECGDERACPTHEFWKQERDKIEQTLRRITLIEVARFMHEQGDLSALTGGDAPPPPPIPPRSEASVA